MTPYLAACAWHGDTLVCPAGLPDGQQVFLAIGPQAPDVALGPLLGIKTLPPTAAMPHALLALYPTDAPVIDRFFRTLAPDKGPRALGPVPRLGIGTRMTTAVWPAIWAAMAAERVRCQCDSELRTRAELPGDAAGGPARREKHCLRLRRHRDRLHRQFLRGAVGGRRARCTQAWRPTALRRRRRPHPGQAGRRRAGAGKAAAGRDTLLLVLYAGRFGCAGL